MTSVMNRGVHRGMHRVLVLSAAVLAVSCGGQPEPAPAEPPAPKVLTASERAAWYQACWDQFSQHNWDGLKACYADTAESEQMDSGQPVAKGPDAIMDGVKSFAAAFPDIKGQAQMVLVSGDHIVGVYVLTGTHQAPLVMPGAPPIATTSKPIGYLMAHAVDTDATGGKVTREMSYADNGTLMAQLGLSPAPARPLTTAPIGSPIVVTATGSETETRNIDLFRAQIDLFNKHDVAGLAAYNAEGSVFHDLTQPTDLDAKGNIAMLQSMFKGFPDARITLDTVWGAGDYVVARAVFEGTNSGALTAMGQKAPSGKPVRVHAVEITKFENGKVKEDWLFMDGLAFATQMGMGGS